MKTLIFNTDLVHRRLHNIYNTLKIFSWCYCLPKQINLFAFWKIKKKRSFVSDAQKPREVLFLRGNYHKVLPTSSRTHEVFQVTAIPLCRSTVTIQFKKEDKSLNTPWSLNTPFYGNEFFILIFYNLTVMNTWDVI